MNISTVDVVVFAGIGAECLHSVLFLYVCVCPLYFPSLVRTPGKPGRMECLWTQRMLLVDFDEAATVTAVAAAVRICGDYFA